MAPQAGQERIEWGSDKAEPVIPPSGVPVAWGPHPPTMTLPPTTLFNPSQDNNIKISD